MLAATARTVNVTGNVTFTASRMDVDVTVYEAEGMIATELGTEAGSANLLDDNATIPLGTIEFDESTANELLSYSYLVKFESNYTAARAINISGTLPITTENGFTITYAAGAAAPAEAETATTSSPVSQNITTANGTSYFLVQIVLNPSNYTNVDSADINIGALFNIDFAA